MKPKYYIVTLMNGKTVGVCCMNEMDAKILAQAVMIKKGFTKEIRHVRHANAVTINQADYVA